MINWSYYPHNIPADSKSLEIVDAFKKLEAEIDSYEHTYKSNDVLAMLEPSFIEMGFKVETGKDEQNKITIPVLYGKNGKAELKFFADAYDCDDRYVVEVEAGRAVVNNQFLKDFFEACSMYNVDYLCIAVRNIYHKNKDFEKVCSFFDALYASGRVGISLKGLLIIGY